MRMSNDHLFDLLICNPSVKMRVVKNETPVFVSSRMFSPLSSGSGWNPPSGTNIQSFAYTKFFSLHICDPSTKVSFSVLEGLDKNFETAGHSQKPVTLPACRHDLDSIVNTFPSQQMIQSTWKRVPAFTRISNTIFLPVHRLTCSSRRSMSLSLSPILRQE